jgi:hypothetical protein
VPIVRLWSWRYAPGAAPEVSPMPVFVQERGFAGILQLIRKKEGLKLAAALFYGVFELLQYGRVFQRRNILRNLFALCDGAQKTTHDLSGARFG